MVTPILKPSGVGPTCYLRTLLMYDLKGFRILSMSEWRKTSHRYNFPSGFLLDAGADVRVLTGCGTDTTTSLYWCSGGAVWNNSGDTAFLLDPSGNIHAQYGY